MEKKISDLTKDEIAKMFPVKLSSHSLKWKEIYEIERNSISNILGNQILRIEHFGSTSIPNIITKDTVDILIEISNENNFSTEIIEKLKMLSYDYVLQTEGDFQHMVFVKGYSSTGEKGQTFHIHMGPKNHKIWDRIFFRDYLTENKNIAGRYEKLKIELAEKHKYDRVGYRIAKNDFVQSITEEAKQYYKNEVEQ